MTDNKPGYKWNRVTPARIAFAVFAGILATIIGPLVLR
jgi:hypothetical protein